MGLQRGFNEASTRLQQYFNDASIELQQLNYLQAPLKLHWSPIEALLKDHWSPIEVLFKPSWHPVAPMKLHWSPVEASPRPRCSPIEAPLELRWSPIGTPLKSLWSAVEAPLKPRWNTDKVLVETPLKPVEAPLIGLSTRSSWVRPNMSTLGSHKIFQARAYTYLFFYYASLAHTFITSFDWVWVGPNYVLTFSSPVLFSFFLQAFHQSENGRTRFSGGPIERRGREKTVGSVFSITASSLEDRRFLGG